LELTLVSYNIHSGIGTDGRFDLHRIGETLREINPDIVALQECGDFRGATDHQEHPELLAELLGLHMAFGPNVVQNGRRYGNAILSRLPILRSRNYDLTVKRKEPRGALRCDLDLGEGEALHVFSLHLGLSMGERRQQEKALLLSADILKDAVREDPLIVCGDFNYWWSGPVPSLVRESIHDVALQLGTSQRTFPSKFPLFRLDRIFIDDGVEPIWVRPHRSNLTSIASDHLPLVMRFSPRRVERAQSPAVQLIG
jgi:endonuclease/exonuclease/phosphatase family metal-dependent hydrolase